MTLKDLILDSSTLLYHRAILSLAASLRVFLESLESGKVYKSFPSVYILPFLHCFAGVHPSDGRHGSPARHHRRVSEYENDL